MDWLCLGCLGHSWGWLLDRQGRAFSTTTSLNHMRKRAFRGRISKSRAWDNLVQLVHSLGHLNLDSRSGHFKRHSQSEQHNEDKQPPPQQQPRSQQPRTSHHSSLASTMASLPTGNLTGAGESSSPLTRSSTCNCFCLVSKPYADLTSMRQPSLTQ